MMRKAYLLLTICTLAFVFLSCKQGIFDQDRSLSAGTVYLNVGGQQGRAVDSEGLPVLKDAQMDLKIVSPGKSETVILPAGAEKTWSGTFPVGEELTITVTVRTAAAQWRGSARHKVTSGVNTVSIKLKKSAAALNSLLFGTDKSHLGGPHDYTLTLKIGSEEIKKEHIINHSFCRDNKGRTYLAYQEGNDYKLERYTSEGNNEDKNFTLPEHCHKLMLASDHTTGKVYLVAEIRGSMKLYRINEDGTHTELTGDPIGYTTGYAVYNNVVVASSYASGVQGQVLKMYRVNGDNLSEITLSTPQLNLSEDTKIMLGSFSDPHVQIKDLYMTSDSLYVLFSDFSKDREYYSLGGIVKYSYKSDGTISRIERIGIKENHTAQNGIYATDDNNLYGPVKVVGFDAENLYIADDGVRFEFEKGKPRIKENKNRIAVLKKSDNNLSFEDSNAEWLAKEKLWVPPAENPLVFFSLNKNNGNTLDKLILSNDVSGSAPIDIASNIELDTDNYRNIFYTFDRDNNFYLGAKDKLKKFTKSDGSYNEDTSFVGSYTSGVPTETPYIKPTYDIVTETLYAVTNGGNYKLVKYTESGWSDTNIDNVYYEYAVYNNKVYLPADAGKMCIQRVQGSSSSAIIQLPKGVTYKRIDDIFIADDYCYVLRKSNFDNLATLTYFDVNTLPSNTSVTHPIPEGQMKELSIEGLTKFENIKFTGYRDGKLYIAVDGIKRSAVEGAPKLENINKTVSFNISAKTFDSPVNVPDSITWFREENEWHGTKTLVWKKNSYGGFDYYQLKSADASLPTETFKPGDGNVSGDNSLTDVFCYDEGGNLYIVKYRSGAYQVCRFALKDDGSYNTSPVIAGGTSSPINISYHSPSAIAVDISGTVEHGGNPVNVLYYESNDDIKRFTWKDNFEDVEIDSTFGVNLHNETVSALAANEDGVFAAVTAVTGKETANEKYTITVKKYAHNGTLSGTVSVTEGNTNWDWNAPDANAYINESLNALYILDGVLYGLTTKRIGVLMKNANALNPKGPTKSVITGKLLKIGDTAAFPANGNSERLDTTQGLDSVDDPNAADISGTFAPYRFIAVKPKKLVIASDGYYAPSSNENLIVQKNKGYIYDLKQKTLNDGVNVHPDVEFSKKMYSTFAW